MSPACAHCISFVRARINRLSRERARIVSIYALSRVWWITTFLVPCRHVHSHIESACACVCVHASCVGVGCPRSGATIRRLRRLSASPTRFPLRLCVSPPPRPPPPPPCLSSTPPEMPTPPRDAAFSLHRLSLPPDVTPKASHPLSPDVTRYRNQTSNMRPLSLETIE